MPTAVRMGMRLRMARPAAHITPKTAMQMNAMTVTISKARRVLKPALPTPIAVPHGGTPTTVTGDMRPSMHETISCSACDTDNGYHLEDIEDGGGRQTCAPNAYSCPHGGTPTTVTGDIRPSIHETISCSACDTDNGYHLEYVSGDSGPQTCVANAYSCPPWWNSNHSHWRYAA